MLRMLLAVVTLLIGFGTASARAQTVVPSSVYAAAQRLVAVDGARRLNLYCIGSGQPVVLLEAGAGNGMVTWRHVQAAIAGFTRVCAYDRAGLGFSDRATRASSNANGADDLHRLLRAADIATPIVFVGHSLGGEIGLRFAADHPEQIAGAVLVDPGFPGMIPRLEAALPPGNRGALLDGFRRALQGDRACLALAQRGMLRHPATKTAQDCIDASGSPDALDGVLRNAIATQRTRPGVWQAMISETEAFLPEGDTPAAGGTPSAAAGPDFGDKPLIVLTRGKQEGAPGVPRSSIAAVEAAWKAGHDRIAALSTRGISTVVPDTGHYIQVEQPDAVIAAVRRVVAELRGGAGR